jgi:hypothetical protein
MKLIQLSNTCDNDGGVKLVAVVKIPRRVARILSATRDFDQLAHSDARALEETASFGFGSFRSSWAGQRFASGAEVRWVRGTRVCVTQFHGWDN